MKFDRCPKCSNMDESFVVLQCLKCRTVIGCYYKRGFLNSAEGCAPINPDKDSCHKCGNHLSFFNNSIYQRIKIGNN